MRCFYCEKISSDQIILEEKERYHIFHVLRLKKNEEILLTDCKGTLATAKIIDNFQILPVSIEKISEPLVKIYLFISPPKKQQLDQIITQSCEIGIWSINLMITERSVSVPDGERKGERWSMKLIEACKQSHNPYAPQITGPLPFVKAVEKTKTEKLNAYFGATVKQENNLIKNIGGSKIGWFVGPEGGFSEKEEKIMLENNFTALNLGNWIMRVETSAITGAAVLQKMMANKNYRN